MLVKVLVIGLALTSIIRSTYIVIVTSFKARDVGATDILMSGWDSDRADGQMNAAVMAYISSSTDNQEIRLVHIDGTQDRSFWRIPSASHPSDGIGTLSWHPSGTELASASTALRRV